MRFGFKTANQGTTWRDLSAVWRHADQVDLFESGWLFDHFYPLTSWAAPSRADDSCLEGWTMLAALAQATKRLRLGTLVTGISYRHPAVLAKMIATVDIISDGRLEIGIGAGWNETESGAYGLPLGSPRERSDRLAEACQVLVSLLTERETTFHGEYYQLTRATCLPTCLQRPHPPICIGGSGERRTLRTAARYAQHWNFVRGTPQEFADKRQILLQHCEDVGRDPRQITLSTHIWLRPDGDVDRTAEEVAAFAERGLDLAIIYLVPPLSPHVVDRVADALRPLA